MYAMVTAVKDRHTFLSKIRKHQHLKAALYATKKQKTTKEKST